MFLLAAIITLTALIVSRRTSTNIPEEPKPPVPPALPPGGQPDPDPPPGTVRWDNITASNVKFQILARREVLVHWFNTLWQWPAESIPRDGNLEWEKIDLTGGVTTHVSVKLTPTNMQFCIYRTKDERIVQSNQYLIQAATVLKAIQTHDKTWYNGVVIWAGFYLDVIVRLA